MGMSESSSAEVFLSQAEEKERIYDWLGAAEFYKKALNLVSETDSFKMGQVQERIGYAFYRAAMQAESVDEFKERMRHAVASYEKAREFYGRLSDSVNTSRMLRCGSMIAYMGYWLTPDVPEKRKLLAECWRLAKDSLKSFKEIGDAWEYGKTYNQLSSSVVFGFCLEWDFQAREKMMKEAVEHGEQAIKFLSTVGDPVELGRTYARTAFYLGTFAYNFVDMNEKEDYVRKAQAYWLKAKELSEDVAQLELLYPVFGGQYYLWAEATDETVMNLKRALEYGRKTRDKFIVGCALDWLVYHITWKAITSEDPDKGFDFAKTGSQYGEEARSQFSHISFVSSRGDLAWVATLDTEYSYYYGNVEADLRKRRELLEKALAAGPDMLRLADESGYPEIVGFAHHVFRGILASLAKIETNSDEKKRLLEKALEHASESIRIIKQLHPFIYWYHGIAQNVLADLKFELANLTRNHETRMNMLQEAILDQENGARLCAEDLAFHESKGVVMMTFATLGGMQYRYGDFLNRLHGFTNNTENLRKAVEAFEQAAQSYQKVNNKSRTAECYWKVAQAYDSLDEHLKAAESFDLASSNYKKAAEKIPQLRDLYEDHMLYMQAWSEIEKARHHHERQEYGLAKEHFENASSIHKSLKQWNYLATNYSAWAQVEQAEYLSRKEQSEEAIKAFEQAANLFNENKNSLQTQLSKIEKPDEKQMATNMLKAADMRHQYCKARIAVEEAKILDKKGDHYSSSEKYGSAATTFEKIGKALESEPEQREIRFIITLSEAWQKMTLAEAESSPALYMEASQLFEQAKESSPNEKTKMLVLGHSRFCRALEAGTKFADTRDPNMHASAVQHLASAANYYTKADFQNASEYAKATKLLFEAYLHMDNAEKESAPEKKAKLYAMAEKVLQTSAGSYTKAEHPEKMEQVLRLLEKVKEERELATSLTEVLHAPAIISTTKAFTTPTPTHEEAVGSERFEQADIQANIITRQKELRVGENLELEIELVNAGKGPALLIKVNEAIPEGFELIEKPETYRVEDSYINMKGKRLDPLKAEELRLVLKPKVQGTSYFKPTILYLDENGKYKSHEPQPITITVKELGIKGWLKGEK